MKPTIVYICGTDTDVGKTVALGAMVAYLSARRAAFHVFKPPESGSIGVGRGLKRSDSDFLSRMSHGRFAAGDINFAHFRQSLAPAIAANLSRRSVNYASIVQRLKNRSRKVPLTLIEGAGGLLVPLVGRKTNLDLIKDLKAKVLLVGRLGLGTLNHTRLTYERLRHDGIDVIGIVLSQTKRGLTLADKTNPGVMRKMRLPLLGVLPYVKSKSPDALAMSLPIRVKRILNKLTS